MSISKKIDGNTRDSLKQWQAPLLDYGASSLGAGLQDTQEKAYEAGFSQGHSEGLKQGRDKVRDQVNCLQSLINELRASLQTLDSEVVDEMVDLVMIVVKQLVRRELKTSSGEIVAVVKEALALLPVSSDTVQIDLHPDDAKVVHDALGGAESEIPWKIVEDPLITRGGCRVIRNMSHIDATVENRINVIFASLMGDERQTDQSQ